MKIKLSNSQWQSMGKKAGFMSKPFGEAFRELANMDDRLKKNKNVNPRARLRYYVAMMKELDEIKVDLEEKIRGDWELVAKLEGGKYVAPREGTVPPVST